MKNTALWKWRALGCSLLILESLVLPIFAESPAGSISVNEHSQGERAEGVLLVKAMRPDSQTPQCANQTCHTDILARKVQHGPVAQKKCMVCHQYEEVREHSFKLEQKVSTLCTSCHALSLRNYVHEPVQKGQCTGCHDPHGSEQRFMLLADPTTGLCLKCHQQDIADKKYVHGPVASGACILCHESHSSWENKLLTKKPHDLCLECHSELNPKGAQGRHVHQPIKDGQCSVCHDPHASNKRYQLRASGKDLCLDCHTEIENKLERSPVIHGAIDAETGCMGCHRPHFSALPKLQKSTQPQLCLTCHDRPIKLKGQKPLTDMATLLKENPNHHGPIREGSCTACHEPHAGAHFRLLSEEYPAGFYAPFSLDRYKLCFSCHIPDMVLKKSGQGLTQFRSDDVNLHWLHVNQEKGRTCRACHEVHASRQPMHIRDSVPFGDRGWKLQIKFSKTPTGGSCSPGCHKQRDYNRAASLPSNPASPESKTGVSP